MGLSPFESLPAPFDRPDLVVFHSTYIPAHARIAARLRRAGIPYVICPRGGMTRYAQSFRCWKKRLANVLFFNRLVCGAAAIHCLTRGEADSSRAWNRPMFVVGNGIDIPAHCELATPGHGATRRLIFIGRLHVQYKGLDMLVDACRLVEAELRRTGSVVEIHGPDCGGSRTTLAQRIARLGLQEMVQLHGPLAGQAKAAVLRGADVFLHPSRSEGHPMAVLEALAYGVPCLLTPATNMAEEVVDAGAGLQVEATVAGIAEGLRQALAAESPWLARAGRNAHRLAAERYGWDRIAAESIEAYRRYAACGADKRLVLRRRCSNELVVPPSGGKNRL